MGQKGGLVTSFIRAPHDLELAQTIALSIVEGGDMDDIVSQHRNYKKKKNSNSEDEI